MFEFFKTSKKLKEARQEIIELKKEVDVWQNNFSQAMDLVKYYKGYTKMYGDPEPSQQFSEEDLRRLIHLCHPDKHNGKQMAVEMTQMLIKMRDQK